MSAPESASRLSETAAELKAAEDEVLDAISALRCLEKSRNAARRVFLLARGWSDVTSGARLMFCPPADRAGSPWARNGKRIYRPAHLAVTLERQLDVAGGAE